MGRSNERAIGGDRRRRPGGSRCADTLRSQGFDGRIVLVGDEQSPPYERPALSKEFLSGERELNELRPRDHWAETGIELRLGRRIERLDLPGRTYAGGPVADALVIATGARARGASRRPRRPACSR